MLNHDHGRVGDLYVAMTRPTQRLRLIAAAESASVALSGGLVRALDDLFGQSVLT